MDRDREHARIVVEHRLHAITVMRVDIDVRDALRSVVEQPTDGKRDVVVDAEPAGMTAHRVMEAAADVDGARGLTSPDTTGRLDARTGDERARLVHLREHRIVVSAQPDRRVDVCWMVAELVNLLNI